MMDHFMLLLIFLSVFTNLTHELLFGSLNSGGAATTTTTTQSIPTTITTITTITTTTQSISTPVTTSNPTITTTQTTNTQSTTTPITTTIIPTTTALSTMTTPAPSTTTLTPSTASATTPNQLLTTSQPTGNTCPEETLNGLTFPLAAIGQISFSTQLCPPGTASAGVPLGSAQCLNLTLFHAFGGLKLLDCGLNLEVFESKANGTLEENINIASSVQMIASKPEQLTSQNITSAATIITNLLSGTMVNELVAESVVGTISQLMQTDKNQYSEDTYGAFESLTKTLEDFALNMININSGVLVQPNLVVQSIKLSNWTYEQVQFYNVTGLSENSNDLLLNIKLQNDSQNDSGNRNLSIGVVLYENDQFFNSKQFKSELDTKRRVVSASLTDKSLLDNVEFSIMPENISTSYDFACVFWDYAYSDWRTEGCVKIRDANGVHCKCNHTTNFAVLVSFRADYTYSEALNWISIVGCSLSIVGLVLTAVYQIKTRKQRGAISTMLLVNICICMTTYYLLFIFGINNPVQSSSVSEKNVIPSSDVQETVDQGPCTAITALLQYFLLSTFAWNILYAAHVFFLIRNALNGPPKAFRTIAMTVGWGLPAAIVGISLSTTYSFRNPLGYRQEAFCWLASLDKAGRFDPKRPMLWGFLLPLAVMLCFNTSLLVYFSQTICCANPNLKSSRGTPMKKKILSSFSLAVVLGLSWVVGYFVLITHEKTLYIILSVVFCLCNTTQGLQIFIFFTLLSFVKTRSRNKLDSKTESKAEP
ncbi:adhesion G-protein coupled receptor G7-like [Puntigrus tetrazona]|uniref:adhesion G-protein coupled receptor G7-like n=1 Tax=Puntigrus tetrazona TaxID=1606681 RepID=UPI001C8A13E9|nr:adhesion G-protein coupled receptor G7-like [Puntigrus tetrazona]